MNFSFHQHKKKHIICMMLITILLFVITFCVIYLNTYYHADIDSIQAFTTTNTVSKQMLEDNTIVYSPENATTGFIFYPGGKVEYTAYAPLMEACASEGILCVLVEMPFHLAVFDINAADGIQEQYPNIQNWYIGGHSLGGSMAASYLANNTEDYDGLILLGSYSTADLSPTSLKVLSIYGSEDNVLNMESYEQNKGNLPSDFTEFIIAGGCHAYFGMYGAQAGDGTPTITNKTQINTTASKIKEFTDN